MFAESFAMVRPNRPVGALQFCSRRLGLVPILGALLIASGCSSARLTQFHNFAQTGTAYVKASQVVLDEAGTAAIDADSLIDRKARAGLGSAEERRQTILRSNEELRTRLLLLRQIGRHGRLLQSYFETLASLADPKAPAELGAAAQGVFDSIGKLSPAIKNASIGGVSVSSAIPQVTNFVAKQFKVKALEKELQARSLAIEREIALQEAAFKVIGNTLETDLTVQLQLEETQEVVEPYATSAELPKDWAPRRGEILQARVASQSVHAAADAAATLRESFIALVEDRLSEPSITQIIDAINSILDLTEKIQKASTSK